MNVFNRVVVVLLLILWLVAVLAVAAFPSELVRVVQANLDGMAGGLVAVETSHFWLYLAGRVLLVLVTVFLTALLLWAELRPHTPRGVKIQTAAGSDAEVTTDSVARRLAWQIDQLPDIVSVRPHVYVRKVGIDVLLELRTSPDVDVPGLTDEIVNLSRQLITERMGLKVGKVEVRVEHAPYQERDEAEA